MWIFKWIFAALLILFIIGFAMQNTDQRVALSFYSWRSTELPLWIMMYTSFAAGLLAWLFLSIFLTAASRTERQRLEKENQKMRKELNRLRNLSVEESIGALGLFTSPSQEKKEP